MALQYIRFTELDPVSSVAAGDIVPVVETITNLNKKISIGDLNLSLPVGGDVSILKANSASWQSTYSNVLANSANWQRTYSSVSSTSSNWDSVYSTVNINSAGWESVEASVLSTSARWNSTYTSVSQTSSNWNSVYTTIFNTSALYTAGFVGATATVAGSAGIVPRPLSGQQVSYLKGDASWGTPGSFQVDVTTNTLPLCNNTGRFSDYNNNRWIFPIVNTAGVFGASWPTNSYHFCQLRFFRPTVITKIAIANIQSVITPSPSDFMRIVITSNNDERCTPNVTLREIVSVPGILNSTGPKVFDVSPPLLVEPGAIWIGAIMSSGYGGTGANQVTGGATGDPAGLELLNMLFSGSVLYTSSNYGYSSKPFASTNVFAVTYNASNAAPANWDNERATYDTAGNSYWNRAGNITQIWCAR